MSDLFDTTTAAERRAATILVDRLRSTEPITRADLNAAMVEGYGGTDADGERVTRAAASPPRR